MAQARRLGMIFRVPMLDQYLAAERAVLALPDLFGPLMVGMRVGFRRSDKSLRVLMELDGAAAAPEHVTRLRFWAARAEGSVLDVDKSTMGQRDNFLRALDECESGAPSATVETLPEAMDAVAAASELEKTRRRRTRVEAALDLDLGDKQATSHDISEGGLFVRSDAAPPVGDEMTIRLVLPHTSEELRLLGRVAHVRKPAEAAPGRPAGFGIQFVAPPPDLFAKLAHLASHMEKPAAAPAPAASSVPLLVRRYESPDAFIKDLHENLAAGGTVVPTTHAFTAGDRARLKVELPGGGSLEALADVVHVLPGAVALHFPLSQDVSRKLQEARIRLSARSWRAVVASADGAWASALQGALTARGLQVNVVPNGEDAFKMVVEKAGELDLLVCDLRTPVLDGPGLVDRVRRTGGEPDLAMFVVDENPVARQALPVPPGADGVFSRGLGAEAVGHAATERAIQKRLRT